MKLTFQPNYAAAFYTRQREVGAALKDSVLSGKCGATIYESADSLLVIIVAGFHPEALTRQLNALHEISEGESFIAPIVSPMTKPPKVSIYFDKIDINSISENLYKEIINQDRSFCLLNIANDQMWILASDSAGLFRDTVGASPARFARMAFAGEATPTPKPPRQSGPYDPLASRVSELITHILPTGEKSVQEIIRKWQQAFSDDYPKLFNSNLAKIRLISDRLAELACKYDNSYVISFVSNCEEQVSSILLTNEYFASALSGYDFDQQNYDSSGSSLVLMGAKNVLNEVSHRLKIDAYNIIVPYFSGDDHSFIKFRSDYDFSEEPDVVLVSIPRAQRLRLGAVPLCGYVPATLMRSDISPWINELLYENSSSPDDFISLLKRLASDQNNERHTTEHFNFIQKISDYAGIIFSDLLVCATLGPAYTYALSRFSFGVPWEYSTDDTDTSVTGYKKSSPSLNERVGWCLGFLKYCEIQYHFNSDFVGNIQPLISDSLFDMVISKVPFRYSKEDHHAAITNIKPELMLGNVVESYPSIILNALWDGVVRKSGYVNELAALVSISRAQDMRLLSRESGDGAM